MQDLLPLRKKLLKKVSFNFNLAFHHRLLISLGTLILLNICYVFVAVLPKNPILYIGTYLDSAIPLVPFFVIFYLLGDIFFFLPFFVMRNEKVFTKMSFLFVCIILISCFLFALLPIPMHKSTPMGNDLFSQLTRFQQRQDTSFNNFPSLHISLNLFGLLMIWEHNKKWALIALPFVACILASTLFIKQHYVIDVLGGIIVACLAYVVFLFWTRKDA